MKFEAMQQATGESVVDLQLALLRENLRRHTYLGFPEPADRLVMDPADLEYDANGNVILPDGPWNVDTHPNRHDSEVVPTPDRQTELLEQGYVLDSRGRPLHPWLLKMIADPLIGVALGKGYNWEWAGSQTRDLVAVHSNHVLMITRGDTGELALPGGYANASETAAEGAVRETAEETGLVIPDGAKLMPFYSGPVADIRATAHSWHDTTAFVVDLGKDGPLPDVTGMDDATGATWVPVESIKRGEIPIHGSHIFLIAKGLGHLSLASGHNISESK